MKKDEFCELDDLRRKLIKLGIGNFSLQKGIKGEKGDPGPLVASSSEGIFFTTFNDSNSSGKLMFDTPWLLPNPSLFFSIYDNNVELEKGIYEISLSGLIDNVDNDHGGSIYLQTSDNAEIKGLSFVLEEGDLSKLYFSKSILFRFEDPTILEVVSYISGDINTSNIMFSDVNLYIKKLHE